MKFRNTFLTVLTFLALMTGALVQAQDDMDMGFDPCFGLAEADCAVINEASANGIGDATSFTVDVNIDFSGTELSGLFDALAAFGTEIDLGSLASLNEATFTLDGTFDVAMDEEGETGSLSGSFTSSFSHDGGEVTELVLDIVVLEDFAYINDGEGWKSIDLERLSESDVAAGMMGMTGMLPGMDAGDDGEEAAANPMGDLLSLETLGTMLGLLEDVPDFVTYERMGDDFAFNLDFVALQVLLTDEYEDAYTELITNASEIDMMMTFMIPTILTVFNEGTFSAVQTVDTDANIVSAYDVDANLSLSLAMLTGETTVSDIVLSADIAISNLNGPGVAEAPANAVDGTDELIAMIEEMMPVEEMEESDD